MAIARPLQLLAAATALGAAAASHAQPVAPDLSGYVTLGSAYWNHGVAQNDGRSLALGIDYQHGSGLFVGGRATTVHYRADDYSGGEPRRVEADVYVGYHRKQGEWSWTAALGRYGYPRAGVSYDYDEWSATAGFRDRLFYTAAYAKDFYGLGRRALNQELSLAWPLRGDFEIGAAVGRFELAGTSVDFAHWNVGVSKVVRRVVLDLRYYDSGYDRTGLLGDPRANHYVLSISYAIRASRPRL